MVTKLEFPSIDRDKMVSPHAQEVEYALILSRMITTVKKDSSQMRAVIYELARAKLQMDMSRAVGASRVGEAERKRLSVALETAIQGVEEYSVRREDQEHREPPMPALQAEPSTYPPELPAISKLAIHEPAPRSKNVALREIYSEPYGPPILDDQARVLLSPLARFFVGILLFGLVAALAIYKERLPELRAGLNLSSPAHPAASVSVPSTPPPRSQQTPVAVEANAAASSSSSQPFPLPVDYGVYVMNNSALSELHLLSEQVPDKRIALSTPLSEPSFTIIPDGKAKFVVFRRDLAGSAPERIDVRVVARVTRAVKFDAKGKPNFSPVSDAWNIRNLSYEFRVRPISGNPEMLLIQAENPDFALPAGRYVLTLRNEGYDFTVAGKVTDPWQCLERTDAANGTFYSDCQKQ